MKSINLYIFTIIFTLLTCHLSFSQTLVQGRVVDPDGKPIGELYISVDGGAEVEVNKFGRFEITLPAGKEYPEKLEAKKSGYRLQNWGYDKAKKKIQVLMWPGNPILGGVVKDTDGKPLVGVNVVLTGVNSGSPVKTDKYGKFSIEMPSNVSVSAKSKFLVDDVFINPNEFTYNESENFVTINYKQGKKSVATQGSVIVKDKDGEVEIKTNPTMVVVVYDSDISPAKNVKVKVDDREFITDEKGEFKVLANEVAKSKFEVEKYVITKTAYEVNEGFMFIYIADPSQTEIDPLDTINIQYEENFNYVFNKLEAEKQSLSENGVELRKEIEKIAQKLEREKGLPEDKRKALEAHMIRLEEALIENDKAYEQVQLKTKIVLDKLKNSIVEKDSMAKAEQKVIKEQDETIRLITYELELAVVLFVISLIATVIIFINLKKIRKQHELLEIAHKDLQLAKDEIEHANEEMLAIRDLGQKFTSKLDLNSLSATVYQGISHLFDATIFGIGIYDTHKNRIEFKNSIKEGKTIPPFHESIDAKDKFSAWCMEHHKEIIINDLEKECHNYLPSTFKYTPDMPNSLVYMPLIIENNQVGVMTVQSYKKNAYQGIDTTMMRTLASYISVAVANANTYDIIKQNNQKMTDNIRYAQTIQNAILPSEDTMRNALKGELFILYRSKDIVSGDFYWFSHLPEYKKSFVAVVDCTGHGVSGAFMSMVGNALLSEIVNQKHIFDTAEILNLLSDGVKIALRQDEKMNDDGMDMCLCAIEPIDDTTVKVIFSGAKRPLYVVRKATGTMETVTGDIKSIGGLSKNRKNFSKKELILSKGDMIYLTSDGFAHQNNADRKKIGSAYFKKVLETNASLPVDEQKRALEKELDLFLTGVEQRDDITALGIRL